ncbi:MAG: hypothetical protein Q9170_008270 [Blastenia crenularia]
MSSSGVGLQVDLPGLSSLVLNMGAAGLKKIAQAGVDIHTLLCMAEIAEICPASVEYRRDISNCRQKQRRESIWIHKVVEIGTATNFIADELLKRRAGENIVALMSTILPILSEDDCDSFILKLFEICKIAADKTPGIGQLQAFRDATLPLAQKLDFKDRTCQYHILINQLRHPDRRPLETSIPGVEILVHIVLMLQKLSLDNDEKHILTYRGWEGAAWVIAYARHVLGLAVCVLRTAQDVIPINGEYHNSRVFVYIFEQEHRCELMISGKVSELVVPNKSVESTCWIVDLDNISLPNLYIPDDPVLREAASTMIKSLGLFFVTRLVHSRIRATHFTEDDLADDPGQSRPRLRPYLAYCLPQIHRRVLKIVETMGFGVSADAKFDMYTWTDYFVQGPKPTTHGRESPDQYPYWFYSPFGGDDSFLDRDLTTIPRLYFNNDCHGLVRRIFNVADTASYLAFSNWGQEFRLMSTSVLEHGLSNDLSAVNFLPGPKGGGYGMIEFVSHFHQLWDRLRTIVKALMHIVVGGAIVRQGSAIAMEFRGMVFAHAANLEDSMTYDGTFIKISSGHIMMLGQKRVEIRDVAHPRAKTEPWSLCMNDVHLRPLNGFPRMHIETTLRLARAEIEIRRTLVSDGRILELHSASCSNDDVLNTWVSDECSHSYYSPASLGSDLGKMIIRHGFNPGNQGDHQTADPQSTFSVYMNAVDQNPCGQWASAHGIQSGYIVEGKRRIIQRGMCTQCILDIIKRHHERHDPSGPGWFYLVIPGGIPDASLGEAITTEDSYPSLVSN